MSVSSLLIAVSAVLASAGVCVGRLDMSKTKLLFVLLCVFALDRLRFTAADVLYLSPACLFIAAACCFNAIAKGTHAFGAVCASLLTGGIMLSFRNGASAWLPYAAGLIAALPAFALDIRSASASAALAPLVAAAASFAANTLSMGFDVLDVTENVLAAQLAGLMAVFMIKSLFYKQKSKIRTTVRNVSAERTSTANASLMRDGA